MTPVAHVATAKGQGAARPLLVLLPGLDATGLLLDEFVAALSVNSGGGRWVSRCSTHPTIVGRSADK